MVAGVEAGMKVAFKDKGKGKLEAQRRHLRRRSMGMGMGMKMRMHSPNHLQRQQLLPLSLLHPFNPFMPLTLHLQTFYIPCGALHRQTTAAMALGLLAILAILELVDPGVLEAWAIRISIRMRCRLALGCTISWVLHHRTKRCTGTTSTSPPTTCLG